MANGIAEQSWAYTKQAASLGGVSRDVGMAVCTSAEYGSLFGQSWLKGAPSSRSPPAEKTDREAGPILSSRQFI